MKKETLKERIELAKKRMYRDLLQVLFLQLRGQ